MNYLNELNDQIKYLDQTLHSSYLTGEPRTIGGSGRVFTLLEEAQLKPKIEQSIAKIQGIVKEHPELMKDRALVESLLTLGENCLPVISKLQESAQVEVYTALEKMEGTVIKNALKGSLFKDLEIDKGLSKLEERVNYQEAKRWLQSTKQKLFLGERLKSHPAYHQVSEDKLDSILSVCKSGTYFITPGQTTSLIKLSCKNRGKNIFFNLELTLDNKLAYRSEKGVIVAGTLEDLIAQLQAREMIPSKLKMIPLERMTLDRAATKIQSAFRGWRTQQLVVFPSQILPFLSQHLIDKKNITDVARGLAREINEMSLNREKFKGKTVHIESLTKLYSYPIIGSRLSDRFLLNFDFWIEMSSDGRAIKLLIKPKVPLLGEGTYKTVHKAQSFEIPLRVQQVQRKMAYNRKVISAAKPGYEEDISESLKKLQDILSKVGKGAKIPSVPRQLKSESPSIKREQEWYNSDFRNVIYNSDIPLDFEPGTSLKVNVSEKLNILMDVALTIQLIHETGFVHRDVKPLNILVNAFLEGFISDFDTLTLPCKSDTVSSDYPYWDTCSRKGWVIPFCDVYGLAMTLGEILIPDFINDKAMIESMEDLKPEFLSQATTAYAERYLNNFPDAAFFKKFLNAKAPASHTIRLINIAIAQNRVPSHVKPILENLKKELEVMEVAVKYIFDIIKLDKEIYAFLENNIQLQLLLSSKNEKDQLLAAQQLQQAFPQASAESFLKNLLNTTFLLS